MLPVVMAGLDLAIDAFLTAWQQRGCPAAQTGLRSLRKLNCEPGMMGFICGHYFPSLAGAFQAANLWIEDAPHSDHRGDYIHLGHPAVESTDHTLPE